MDPLYQMHEGWHGGMSPHPLICLLALLVFVVIPMGIVAVTSCLIFRKAGLHWALGLLMLIPIVHAVLLFYLAFAKWPIEKRLETLERGGAGPR